MVADRCGESEVALAGDAEHAVWVGADHQEAVGFADVESGAGCPAERVQDGLVGDAAPAIHRGQAVHGGTGARCRNCGKRRVRWAADRPDRGPVGWPSCRSGVAGMTTGLITEPVMTTTPAAGGTAGKTLVQRVGVPSSTGTSNVARMRRICVRGGT